MLIDGASVKDGLKGLLNHGLKLNFHRYIGQLRRLPPPHQKTPWRRFFVHKWHVCEDGDYVHAERNDKDIPQNSRRRKDTEGVARVVLLVRNKVRNDDRTVV